MTLQEIKSQISQNIDQINSLDLSKLYSEGVSVLPWNEMNVEEIKSFVADIVSILNELKNNITNLDVIPREHLNSLKSHIGQIVVSYNNNNLPSLTPSQITSQHHTTLSYFNNTINTLRSLGLYSQLKLTPSVDEITKKLKEANTQLKDFSLENFEKATSLVNDLIQKKISFEEITIKEHLGTFIERANEHRIHKKQSFWSLRKFSGQWWWLFGAIIMGSIVGYFVSSFITILENDNDISIGTALLRISSLVIPSYFMIFFINQFTYHKKMYESYSFKNSALNTMTVLMKTNQNKAESILEKGLEVLFTEPQIKEGGKYDKQLVSDVLGILKSQSGR